MCELRTRYGVPGEAKRPAAAQVRTMRLEEHGKGLLDVRSQVRKSLPDKLPERDLSAFLK